MKEESISASRPGSGFRGGSEPADLPSAPALKEESSPASLPNGGFRGGSEPAGLPSALALKEESSPASLPGSGFRGGSEPAGLPSAPALKEESSPASLPGGGFRGGSGPSDLPSAPAMKEGGSPAALPGSGFRGNGEAAGLLFREGSLELDPNRWESRFPSQGDKDARNVPFEAEENLGNSILQSLARESSPAQRYPLVGAADQPIGMRVDLDKMEALIAKVANRVLVTDPQSGQNPEVRVRVAPDLMPGTEVKLWKGDGGRLHIEFDTTSPQWAKILSESVSVLADRLGARIHLHETPEVTVRHSAGDMPGDGRSRQGGSQQQRQQQQQQDPDTGE
jgi:type III secretion system needle length determinant